MRRTLLMVAGLLALSACKKEAPPRGPDHAMATPIPQSSEDVVIMNNYIESLEENKSHCHNENRTTFVMVGKVTVPIYRSEQVCDYSRP